MGKPVLGLLLGGVLGIFDGLTARLSAPEVAPQIVGIVIGSTVKGLLFGLAIGAFFAFLVAAMPQPSGEHYYLEIILPGSVVGLIVGYATQRWGGAQPARQA